MVLFGKQIVANTMIKPQEWRKDRVAVSAGTILEWDIVSEISSTHWKGKSVKIKHVFIDVLTRKVQVPLVLIIDLKLRPVHHLANL